MNIRDLQVIFEDNHLIAVNKPAGALVHGDETEDITVADVVKQYIKVRYNKPGNVFLGVIHRIDRPVSGALIFARTSKALSRMNQLLREKAIKKTYYAISDNRPEPHKGQLTHYLLKDTTKNYVRAFTKQKNKNAKKATLDYQLIASIGNHHLLEVHPKTGRPHQIRVQLAKLGSIIRGDVKYGAKKPSRKNRNGSILLHSRALEFIHPVKKDSVHIIADIPNTQLWNQFRDFLGD